MMGDDEKIRQLQGLIRKGPSSYTENEKVFMYSAQMDNKWRWGLLKPSAYSGTERRKRNRRAT
jgi:hypothetical protein